MLGQVQAKDLLGVQYLLQRGAQLPLVPGNHDAHTLPSLLRHRRGEQGAICYGIQ
jgi:hypothetical protein